jgi:hypothetical protein
MTEPSTAPLERLLERRRFALNRSTGGMFTPLAYLNIIQTGSVPEWSALHEACRADPKIAAAVAEMLPIGDPLQIGALRIWADLVGAPWPEYDSNERGI